MQAAFPGVEFLKDFIQVRKEEGKSLSCTCVQVLHKTSNLQVLRLKRQRNVLKRVMHVQSCCFDH